jgi:hypothetical protein
MTDDTDFSLYEKRKIEARKIQIDVIKHVTTMSTGTLVLTVTLLDKLFHSPRFLSLFAVSLFCLVASIVGGFVLQTHCVMEVESGEYDSKVTAWAVISFVALCGGFVGGLILLTLFILLNLVGK